MKLILFQDEEKLKKKHPLMEASTKEEMKKILSEELVGHCIFILDFENNPKRWLQDPEMSKVHYVNLGDTGCVFALMYKDGIIREFNTGISMFRTYLDSDELPVSILKDGILLYNNDITIKNGYLTKKYVL